MLKPALVCLLLLAGCGDPCSTAAQALATLAPGIGNAAVYAACAAQGSATAQQPVAPEQQPADMGASPPADMAILPPVIVHDLSTPPDLSPVIQTLFAQGSFFWTTDNGAQRYGATVSTQAAFDFGTSTPIYAGVSIPITPLNSSPEKFKTRDLSAALSFDLTWGPFDTTFCPTVGRPAAYLVKSGTNQTCIEPYVGFQFYINGMLKYDTSAPAGTHMAFSLPSALPVLPGQALAYKVLVNGNATLSNFNAIVSVKQSY